MSGLEIPALVALVGGTALTATSQVMQGREQARAADFENQQLSIQEQATRTAAMQDEARRRDELTSNLETIQAIRAGRGVGAGSPGGMAILDSITSDAERDIGISKSNYATKADLTRRAGEMAQGRGRMSLLAGYLGAGATVGNAAYQGYAVGRYPVPAPRGRSV